MPTWVPIGTNTIGSGVTTVNFNSFAGYTDLVLICSAASANPGNALYLRFNSSTAPYAWIQMYANGSNLSSNYNGNNFAKVINNLDSAANVFGAQYIWIPNYNDNTNYKQVISRSGGATYGTMWSSSAWQGGAITSITLTDETGGNIRAGSTFTLFGILAA